MLQPHHASHEPRTRNFFGFSELHWRILHPSPRAPKMPRRDSRSRGNRRDSRSRNSPPRRGGSGGGRRGGRTSRSMSRSWRDRPRSPQSRALSEIFIKNPEDTDIIGKNMSRSSSSSGFKSWSCQGVKLNQVDRLQISSGYLYISKLNSILNRIQNAMIIWYNM